MTKQALIIGAIATFILVTSVLVIAWYQMKAMPVIPPMPDMVTASSSEIIVHEAPVYPEGVEHPPIVRFAEDANSMPAVTFEEAKVDPND